MARRVTATGRNRVGYQDLYGRQDGDLYLDAYFTFSETERGWERKGVGRWRQGGSPSEFGYSVKDRSSTPFSSFSSSRKSSSRVSPRPSVSTIPIAVPFVWEEKPGVSKSYTKLRSERQPLNSLSSLLTKPLSGDQTTHTALIANSIPTDYALEARPLRPPPRLQQQIKKAGTTEPQKGSKLGKTTSREWEHAKALIPSLLKKKPHKASATNGEDDPFLMAMKACRGHSENEIILKGKKENNEHMKVLKCFVKWTMGLPKHHHHTTKSSVSYVNPLALGMDFKSLHL
eukprot:c16450_g1_i1 orf=358-1218(+)